MNTDPSDADLVARGQTGDQRALAEIYRRFSPFVTATARHRLGRSSDVNDVVQDTFMIVFAKLGHLATPGALRGWIRRITINCAHRRFRRDCLMESDDDALAQQVSNDASPEHQVELALIVRALRIPVRLRTPWVLRHVVGASLEDVAAACGWSLATVKRRLAEADLIVARFVANAVPGRASDLGPRASGQHPAPNDANR